MEQSGQRAKSALMVALENEKQEKKKRSKK